MRHEIQPGFQPARTYMAPELPAQTNTTNVYVGNNAPPVTVAGITSATLVMRLCAALGAALVSLVLYAVVVEHTLPSAVMATVEQKLLTLLGQSATPSWARGV